MGNSCSPDCRLWCLYGVFVLSFFPLDVLDGIWDLIESVSEGFLTYSLTYTILSALFIVSYWRKYVREVLVNRLGGLSLPRKSVVRLTDRPDMTFDVYRRRKINNTTTTTIHNKQVIKFNESVNACIHTIKEQRRGVKSYKLHHQNR